MPRSSSVGTRLGKLRAVRDYKLALAEYRRLVTYLKAAVSVLPQADCELLTEFAELSKRKCQRLRRALERKYGKHLSAA